eukprot:10303089-Heterocapsa_arctica.AAC.1
MAVVLLTTRRTLSFGWDLKAYPKESRKLPVIWTNNGYVITLRRDPDGFASYGRVHWYGIEGMIANSTS